MRYKGVKNLCWQEIRRITFARSRDCYTCPNKDLVSYNLQAGHYLPVAIVGSNNYLSWNTDQIRTQCSRCNGAGQGMAVEFRKNLVKEFSEKFVLDLEAKRWKVDKVKNFETLLEELKLK